MATRKPSDERDTRGNAAEETADRPSYEAAREELVEVVRALETGGITLEESLALWERGEALARRCEEWLVGAKARLDAARAAADAGRAS
jgi:exodeoxyribonuclease VII small subunit